MSKHILAKQILSLILVFLLFAALNGYIYIMFTRRLKNNFSGTDQAKMIDVAEYLPFENSPAIPRIDSSLKLDGSLPVLDGAAALVPVYAAFIENTYPEGSVTYEGGVFSDDNFYGENFAADSKMQYRNTIRGFKAVVDGDADIFFSAAPSGEQLKYAEDKGVKLICTPIGLEAFVFFVNKNNPVDDLTTGQVRDIYGGKIKNWSEAGGANRPINPVTRLSGSGSQTAMESFMGEETIAKKSPLALFGGSVGYSFRYYMSGIVNNGSVKMLSLNGVYPSSENIRNGSYPVIAEFYAIYRKDNANENVNKLVNWILTDEGQQLIEETGYVGLE